MSVLAVGGVLAGAAAVADDPRRARGAVTLSVSAARLPRDLHPVAWWLWAIGLAVAASFTTNPLLLLLLIGVAARWSSCCAAPTSRGRRSFRLYVWLGRGDRRDPGGLPDPLRRRVGGHGAARPARDPAARLGRRASRLLGPVTAEALLAGLYDGLRLATIVICVGAANSLANPKRLLRSVPPALYEIGTALVVAVTVLPQFAESVRRVRAAQALRGGRRPAGSARLRRFLVPVLEDALERSLRAGRRHGHPRLRPRRRGRRRRAAPDDRGADAGRPRAASASASTPSSTPPRRGSWPLPMLAVGVAARGRPGWSSAGRRVAAHPLPPRPRGGWPELVVVASGLVVAGGRAGGSAEHQTRRSPTRALDAVSRTLSLARARRGRGRPAVGAARASPAPAAARRRAAPARCAA